MIFLDGLSFYQIKSTFYFVPKLHYFCVMNFISSLIIILLILVLNLVTYNLFKRYICGKVNAGMKFLVMNIPKDIIWLIISFMIVDKTKENFLFIVICFIAASLLIYIPVIRLINKS